MTATELYAIVKDVPREAWPRGIGYSAALRSFEHAQERTHTVFDDDHAAIMFVGSMAAEVVRRGGAIMGYPILVILTKDSGKQQHFTAPTLIEALAAACKGVA